MAKSKRPMFLPDSLLLKPGKTSTVRGRKGDLIIVDDLGVPPQNSTDPTTTGTISNVDPGPSITAADIAETIKELEGKLTIDQPQGILQPDGTIHYGTIHLPGTASKKKASKIAEITASITKLRDSLLAANGDVKAAAAALSGFTSAAALLDQERQRSQKSWQEAYFGSWAPEPRSKTPLSDFVRRPFTEPGSHVILLANREDAAKNFLRIDLGVTKADELKRVTIVGRLNQLRGFDRRGSWILQAPDFSAHNRDARELCDWFNRPLCVPGPQTITKLGMHTSLSLEVFRMDEKGRAKEADAVLVVPTQTPHPSENQAIIVTVRTRTGDPYHIGDVVAIRLRKNIHEGRPTTYHYRVNAVEEDGPRTTLLLQPAPLKARPPETEEETLDITDELLQ